MNKTKFNLGLLILAVVMVTGTSQAFGPPPPPSLPDAGSTALMTSLALGGLALVRRFIR
jgi:hypothetical protein